MLGNISHAAVIKWKLEQRRFKRALSVVELLWEEKLNFHVFFMWEKKEFENLFVALPKSILNSKSTLNLNLKAFNFQKKLI